MLCLTSCVLDDEFNSKLIALLLASSWKGFTLPLIPIIIWLLAITLIRI